MDYNNNDFYDTNEQYKRSGGKGRLVGIIVAVALLCTVLGGAIGMILSGEMQKGAMSDDVTSPPGNVAEATPSPQPTKDVELNTDNLPTIGGALPSLIGDGNVVVQVVDAMGDAVVAITTQVKDTSTTNRWRSGNEERFITQQSGSGFVVSDEGYILTNSHVVNGGDRIRVLFTDGEIVDATLVGEDVGSDIAVLKVERKDLVVAALGDSDAIKVGELAIAIGSPLGSQLSNSVTVGVISALNRRVSVSDSSGQISANINYIQTDAAINPGNSGGPLVNARGEVIAINTLKSTSAGYDEFGNSISAEGIGFSIPINETTRIVEQLILRGYYARPGIGVGVSEIDEITAAEFEVPVGISVDEVYSGSPAEQGGLKVNDIITAIDGQEQTNVDEFVRYIQSKNVGDVITFDVYRGGTTLKVSVTLADINKLNTTNDQAQQPITPQTPGGGNWWWPFN
ncbi:MAG: S1C family serine protease [Christensenellales bacterium]|jgi:serine protease Do